MGHKRNHHVIPRLYLKGFAESREHPFVWVYTKGKPFNPGKFWPEKHNPARMPISKAAVIPHAYSFTGWDGTFDPDTYENELERLEKPSNWILRKIRSRMTISQEEKTTFADYIYLMHKRVPEPEDQARRKWAEVLQNWELMKELRSKEVWNRLSEKQRMDVEEWLVRYKDAPPKEASLQAMISKSEPVSLYLRKMTWRFLVPSGSSNFITGDRPVAITGLGLIKLLSELTFPISVNICLHASWQLGEEGFYPVPESYVKEINHRTATNSAQLFADKSRKWIADIFNKGNYPIYLLNFVDEFKQLWEHRDILAVPKEWLI